MCCFNFKIKYISDKKKKNKTYIKKSLNSYQSSQSNKKKKIIKDYML